MEHIEDKPRIKRANKKFCDAMQLLCEVVQLVNVDEPHDGTHSSEFLEFKQLLGKLDRCGISMKYCFG